MEFVTFGAFWAAQKLVVPGLLNGKLGIPVPGLVLEPFWGIPRGSLGDAWGKFLELLGGTLEAFGRLFELPWALLRGLLARKARAKRLLGHFCIICASTIIRAANFRKLLPEFPSWRSAHGKFSADFFWNKEALDALSPIHSATQSLDRILQSESQKVFARCVGVKFLKASCD